MVITPIKKPINPWDPYDPTAAMADDTAAMGDGGDTAAAPAPSWQPPPPADTGGPRAIAPDAGPSPIDGGSSAPDGAFGGRPTPALPQQLPDGSGGVIPVPPPEMAPPTTGTDTGGGSVPIPTGTGGWEQPLGFPAQPLPGGGDNIGDPIRDAPIVEEPAPPAPEGEFTEDDNLISDEILPGTDPRATEQNAAGDAGLAAQDAAPDIAPPGANPRLLKFQQMTDDLLAQMRNQPDRLGLAKQYYDTFSKQTEGDFDRSLTRATDLGAAHGRLGSGQLTNSYGDLTERRLRDKEAARERLLNDATAGTIADRQQTYENFAGAERNAFGEAGADVDELQEEREARRRLIDAHYGQADRSLAQGRSDRDETRGERGYQQDMANQALIRRILQQQEERAEEGQNFDQSQGQFGAGNTGDPTDTYLSAADQQALQAAAAAGDVALMMRILAQRRGQNQNQAA